MTITGPVTFSSPITFNSLGGFSSGQNTDAIVAELEQLDQPTLSQQQQNVQNLTTEQNTLSIIGSQLGTLQNAFSALSTQTSPTQIGSALQAVATAYNSVISTVNEQMPQMSATGTIMPGPGSLDGDPVVLQLQGDLSGITTLNGGQPGITFGSMAEIGVTVDASGQMNIDQTALQNALNTDPNAVSNLLTDPSNGLIQQVNSTLSQYTDSTSGFLLGDAQTLQGQIDGLNTSIQQQSNIASDYGGGLQTQFTQMQQTLAADNTDYQLISNIYTGAPSPGGNLSIVA